LPAVNLETVKTLVALHGQTITARKTGLNLNTVKSWTKRYGWKVALPVKLGRPANARKQTLETLGKLDATQPQLISSTDALLAAVAEFKERSTLALSQYVAEAGEEAKAFPSGRKLLITRKAKDLSDIHKNLWPAEQQSAHILNLAVLVGSKPPKRLTLQA